MDSPGVSSSASIHTHRSQLLCQRFLTDAASGLTFSPDTETELGPDRVSYSQADFSRLFRPSGALRPAANMTPYRPAPRFKPQHSLRELPGSRRLPPILQPPESVEPPPPHTRLLLQNSCRRTGVRGVKPVHKTPHKTQIILNDSKYPRNWQKWSCPVLNTTSTHTTGTHTTSTHTTSTHTSTHTTGTHTTSTHTTGTHTSRHTTGTHTTGTHTTSTHTTGTHTTGTHTTGTHTSTESVTTESLNGDHDLQDQVQTRPPQSDGHSWMDAQYLVLDHSKQVIQRLLAQLLQEDQAEDQDQPPDVQLVTSLLIFLSSRTTLVRSLLAEQLNSCESKNRLLVCNMLSRLNGPINKDVVHKLIHLMWNNQSEAVRLAAAETLMKLGRVQDVHSQLRVKLEDGRGLKGRMEALELISSLKFTTVKLLESLVSCLKDEFSVVRKQACVTAAALQLKDETVVSRLLELLQYDPAPEVRLSAIKAVCALGLSSEDVQETLQRCVETEEDAELRLAACRLLQGVCMPLDKLQDFLLQQLDAESNGLVRRTMEEMLRLCDCRLQEERCDAHNISPQGKLVCEWKDITDTVLEKLQDGPPPRPADC